MIDMHVHSNFSDGDLTIFELLEKLKENNITHAVLTDHDCIIGTSQFLEESKKYNIKTIPGVELEAYYDIENSLYLHMLCYDFKDSEGLNSFLEQQRINRIGAINEAIIKLKKYGFETTLDEVKSMSCGRHLLINHLCILLERKGFIKSKYEAYNLFLNSNSELFVNYPKPSVENIVTKILDVGGIPVLAHPKRIMMSNCEKENYVAYLKKIGVNGIESYYGFNDSEETLFSNYLAEKYNLLETVGSDWHCEAEGISFGNNDIPLEKVKILKRRFFYE